MTTAQTPFYKSGIYFGSELGVLPCYPGAVLECPENYDIPPIIGNYWAVNFGEGLKQPYLTVRFALRDAADGILKYGGNVASPVGLLDYLIPRTATIQHDTATIDAIEYYDGQTYTQMYNAKLDALSVSAAKGSDIVVQARFCGAGMEHTSSSFDTITYGGWHSTRNMVRFKNVNFSGGLANRVWSFNLNYTNNHTPNLELDGTAFPSACEAGMMAASLDVVVQAADSGSPADVDTPPAGPLANGTSVNLVISNAAATRVCTLTIPYPLNMNPRNRAITVPRNMRRYAYAMLGSDSQSSGVLSAANSGAGSW